MENMGSYGSLNDIKVYDASEPDSLGYMLGRFEASVSGEDYNITGSYVISTENPDITITFDDNYKFDHTQDIKDAINDAYPEEDEDEYLEDEME